MADESEEPGTEHDLGALLGRIFPRLVELESPILAAADLSMWEYVILTELASGTAVSQAELAGRTRRDPTRLGRHLDDLASRKLISRERSGDKRQLAVRLTPRGTTVLASVKARIRTAEDDFLRNVFSQRDAHTMRSLLTRLATAAQRPPAE